MFVVPRNCDAYFETRTVTLRYFEAFTNRKYLVWVLQILT